MSVLLHDKFGCYVVIVFYGLFGLVFRVKNKLSPKQAGIFSSIK